MNNDKIIRILLRVIDRLLGLIDVLDTEKKLTATLKQNTDELSDALNAQQTTPTQKE
jgi:hypothetical protein